MAKIKNAPKKEQKKTVKIPAAAPKPAENTTEKPAAKKEETVEAKCMLRPVHALIR